MIFPRYHQWDAVLSLSAHARANGAGQSYLVQHSAGSGKSNTIAWLAHRLSSLHDAGDEKVFDKVVIITDRVVLDKQLQDTIYQFEHAYGVVEKIDQSSTQLAEALSGQAPRVIITTLQKFPFVLDKVEGLPARPYAVLVNEAHFSQTGETAKDMKKVLGFGAVAAGDLAAEESNGYGTEPDDPSEDALVRKATARGRQDNLSFFAFTATPKGRTLEMFGTFDQAAGHHVPSHPLVDLLFVGDQEAQGLWGRDDEESVRELAEGQGPQEIVLKRGKRGSLVLLRGKILDQPAFSAVEVNPLGAGDAFDAGYLAGYLWGLTPEERLRTANAMGAFSVATLGDYACPF